MAKQSIVDVAAAAMGDSDEPIQIIASSPDQLVDPDNFEFREMRLEDLEDDCPACQAARAQIEAGNPPKVYAPKAA